MSDPNELYLNGKATDLIWLMGGGPEPHVIGVRMDEGDSGVVYVTLEQAEDLAKQLLNMIARLKPTDAVATQAARPEVVAKRGASGD